MDKRWLLIGTVLASFIVGILFPFVVGIPWSTVFAGDAESYSAGAISLLQTGMYSLDGIHPAMTREPVMSFFLVPIYALFGTENALALSIVQMLLLFFASWAFCTVYARSVGSRAAGITFIILLTSGSVMHTVFSAYRECLVLSLLLLFSAVYLRRSASVVLDTILMGVLFALVLLTYYSFVFFPLFFAVVWLRDGRSFKQFALFCVVAAALTSLWGLRNMSYDGTFRIIDNRRTAVMWHVRGEQAERIRGTEPFWCLWSEYVSRNWDGRSDACSYNALMHAQWPDGFDADGEFSDTAARGKEKILAYFPWYLWFSVFEVLELHLPYLGGGWSSAYNLYASLTQLLLAIGCAFGLSKIFEKRLSLIVAFALYNTLVFILTDATPRYLLPVFFAYAALAGVGYDAALQAFRRLRS